MVDVRGKELDIGDEVVFCGSGDASSLGIGTVLKFTAKKVYVQAGPGPYNRYLKFPSQVAKVGA